MQNLQNAEFLNPAQYRLLFKQPLNNTKNNTTTYDFHQVGSKLNRQFDFGIFKILLFSVCLVEGFSATSPPCRNILQKYAEFEVLCNGTLHCMQNLHAGFDAGFFLHAEIYATKMLHPACRINSACRKSFMQQAPGVHVCSESAGFQSAAHTFPAA